MTTEQTQREIEKLVAKGEASLATIPADSSQRREAEWRMSLLRQTAQEIGAYGAEQAPFALARARAEFDALFECAQSARRESL